MAEKPHGRTAEQTSALMKKIGSKGSKIEVTLQKELWSRGLRYRKNVTRIPGKPDICFIGLKIAVFCDSEVWHGYNWDERKKDFKSNRDFWIPKIKRNIERDKEVTSILESEGWRVLRFWGKDLIKNTNSVADTIEAVYRERKQSNGK